MMLDQLNPILTKLSLRAKADSAEAEVLATAREGLSITSDKKRLGKFSSNLSLVAGVRVVKNGAEGYCSTEDLSEKALVQAYEEALANAEFNSKHGVADPDLKMIGKQTGYREIERPDIAIDPSQIESKIQKAIELESACFERDKRVTAVAYNGYSETRAEVRVFNTNGVDQSYRDYSVSAYAYPLAKQGEETRMASEIFIARNPAEFNPKTLADAATDKAVAKLGSTQPLTGRYPILLDREPAESLIDFFLGYLSAKSVHEKLSVYEGKLEQPVASKVFSLIDDPFLDEGIASRPFDSEGVPSKALTMVENGILKSYLLNSIYSRKLKMSNTGHASRSPMGTLDIGPSNSVVKPGVESREQLLKRHPKTIVITELMGLHAGFQEGSSDFSFQAEGELWENGKRVSPLSDFVVSGNLKEMMMNIEAVASWPTGKAAAIDSSVVTPELLISELSIAGRSN